MHSNTTNHEISERKLKFSQVASESYLIYVSIEQHPGTKGSKSEVNSENKPGGSWDDILTPDRLHERQAMNA